MRRGTTPTLTFDLPFDGSNISKCSIAFEQNRTIVLEKKLADIIIEGNRIKCPLSEEDTLSFCSSIREVEVQIRLAMNGQVLASNPIHFKVERIIKDGVLQ